MTSARARPGYRTFWITKRLLEAAVAASTLVVCFLAQGTDLLLALQLSLMIVSIYAVGLFYWPVSYLATYLRPSSPFIDTLVFLTHACVGILVWFNGWNGLVTHLAGALPIFLAWSATATVNVCMSLAWQCWRPK